MIGGKGGAGVWQRIISEMPTHNLYIEAFAGSAQVLRHKRLAGSTIAIDSDPAVCQELLGSLHAIGVPTVSGSGIARFIERRPPGGLARNDDDAGVVDRVPSPGQQTRP